MHNRPILNTRDEPHADRRRFRRLHLILGDANMCEYATALKVGTTQLVLELIERAERRYRIGRSGGRREGHFPGPLLKVTVRSRRRQHHVGASTCKGIYCEAARKTFGWYRRRDTAGSCGSGQTVLRFLHHDRRG